MSEQQTLAALDAAARPAAPQGLKAHKGSHSLPVLEGPSSRRHHRRGLRRLALEARLEAVRRRRTLSQLTGFVQFVGFPRSGHSLVGALLDAHPQIAISHELDAMGLFAKGVPPRAVAALALRQAEAFRADGAWWNGLRYEVGGAPPRGTPRVAGDKKGDWTSRWCALDPSLPERFRRASRVRTKYVLIARHPLDNVATMTLRLGRTYDQLRIDAPREGFAEALAAAQAEGRIPSAASDEMIGDYAALCAATEAVRLRTRRGDWFCAAYEDLAASPARVLAALAAFLGVDADPRWLDAAAAHLRPAGRSRGKLAWTPPQEQAVMALTRRYEWLEGYADD